MSQNSSADRVQHLTQGLEPAIEGKLRRPAPSQQARKTDDIDLLIGKRLRERRMLLAITQEDLAQRIQLSPQQLQKYEIGENRISAARLFRLSKVLEVPITWFFASVAMAGDSL